MVIISLFVFLTSFFVVKNTKKLMDILYICSAGTFIYYIIGKEIPLIAIYNKLSLLDGFNFLLKILFSIMIYYLYKHITNSTINHNISIFFNNYLPDKFLRSLFGFFVIILIPLNINNLLLFVIFVSIFVKFLDVPIIISTFIILWSLLYKIIFYIYNLSITNDFSKLNQIVLNQNYLIGIILFYVLCLNIMSLFVYKYKNFVSYLKLIYANILISVVFLITSLISGLYYTDVDSIYFGVICVLFTIMFISNRFYEKYHTIEYDDFFQTKGKTVPYIFTLLIVFLCFLCIYLVSINQLLICVIILFLLNISISKFYDIKSKLDIDNRRILIDCLIILSLYEINNFINFNSNISNIEFGISITQSLYNSLEQINNFISLITNVLLSSFFYSFNSIELIFTEDKDYYEILYVFIVALFSVFNIFVVTLTSKILKINFSQLIQIFSISFFSIIFFITGFIFILFTN